MKRGSSNIYIRIQMQDSGALGPETVRILESVQKTGSIRASAQAMNIGYLRAWQTLNEIEKIFGAPVIERRIGGARGGGSSLTPLGLSIIKRYRTVERDAGRAARAEVTALRRLQKR